MRVFRTLQFSLPPGILLDSFMLLVSQSGCSCRFDDSPCLTRGDPLAHVNYVYDFLYKLIRSYWQEGMDNNFLPYSIRGVLALLYSFTPCSYTYDRIHFLLSEDKDWNVQPLRVASRYQKFFYHFDSIFNCPLVLTHGAVDSLLILIGQTTSYKTELPPIRNVFRLTYGEKRDIQYEERIKRIFNASVANLPHSFGNTDSWIVRLPGSNNCIQRLLLKSV